LKPYTPELQGVPEAAEFAKYSTLAKRKYEGGIPAIMLIGAIINLFVAPYCETPVVNNRPAMHLHATGPAGREGLADVPVLRRRVGWPDC
jgi:hypothetical protein